MIASAWTQSAVRGQLTEDERRRVSSSTEIRATNLGYVYEVDVPARLSHAFVSGNALHHGNALIEAVPLADGWVRTSYLMGAPKDEDISESVRRMAK